MNIDCLLTLELFLPIRAEIRESGKKLVWTNGCFDILHAGHVLYLEQAKSLGDVLLVGLNSDSSYRKLKNRPGPINHQDERTAVLLGLSSVDYVILFDEASAAKLLAAIQPDFYVKGDDYDIKKIDPEERRVVENYGGRIEFCSGLKGASTTDIIRRILDLYR